MASTRYTLAAALLLSFITAVAATSRIPAAHSNIRYMGRTVRDDGGNVSFTFPGTSALFEFSGTSLAMEASAGCGRFAVEIDGGAPEMIAFTSSDSIITLADKLKDTIHTARIAYATEGYELLPQIRAFHTDGSILPDRTATGVKIEFIGNSMTCGYGIEESNPENGFSYDTENHTLSYAYLTARALNADFNVVARSGIGIYRNWASPREGGEKTMPDEYDYTLLYNHDLRWNPEDFIPDIVCINLGTNDFSLGNYDISLFETRYRKFLAHLRDIYPEAKIVLLSGAMMQGEELEKLKTVLDRLASEDDNFHRFDMSPQTGSLGYGAAWHPSARQARKMADELTSYLKSLTKP